jgi:hypothetical protein
VAGDDGLTRESGGSGMRSLVPCGDHRIVGQTGGSACGSGALQSLVLGGPQVGDVNGI